MPIKIAEGLTAINTLNEEGIVTITSHRAETQDIRPLKILILNLMPLKETTELQFLRLLGNSPLQIEVDFCHSITHTATHTDSSYIAANYLTFPEIKNKYYDGMIITGAPVETMPFEQVDYWQEIVDYLEWAKNHVFSTLHLCWGAQAALYHYYGINKIPLQKKLFGVYSYELTVKNNPLLRGFDDRYFIPQSRHTVIDDAAVDASPELQVLSRSTERGINIVTNKNLRQIFVLGHFEYGRRTLEEEYRRDKQKGLPIAVPDNYYPYNIDTEQPMFNWCSYAHLFYSNWLNYVYQETPYDLRELHPLYN